MYLPVTAFIRMGVQGIPPAISTARPALYETSHRENTMKTIITGFVALAMIGAVAAVAPTLDGNDPHLQPRTIILQTEEQAAPDTRLAAQDAAARQAEDTLREIVDGLTDYEIMRGVVYEEPTGD